MARLVAGRQRGLRGGRAAEATGLLGSLGHHGAIAGARGPAGDQRGFRVAEPGRWTFRLVGVLHQEGRASDLDRGTGGDGDLLPGFDRLAVDDRSVGLADAFDEQRAARRPDAELLASDLLVVDRHIGSARATDDDRPGDGDHPGLLAEFANEQLEARHWRSSGC
jgi:hypothetical protein